MQSLHQQSIWIYGHTRSAFLDRRPTYGVYHRVYRQCHKPYRRHRRPGWRLIANSTYRLPRLFQQRANMDILRADSRIDGCTHSLPIL